ncbi:hypothetical protein IPJ91_02050 [bacterium]|nr:MAG: hypothetical protein IPJ91_02050 [bacterium]
MDKKNHLDKNYEGIVEQIIRPTGLLDPEIEIRPIDSQNFSTLRFEIENSTLIENVKHRIIKPQRDLFSQIIDLISEITLVVEKKQRVFVTTLTKRMSEELTEYLKEKNIKVQYLHSDLDAIERVEILRDLRLGVYDVVVGINLLREGLDVPEVSLVAILDADKEGFLRSKTSLIQTIGRAARHESGKVLMYADHLTDSMIFAINETYRRREIQENYNIQHHIVPKSVMKEINSTAILTRSENPVDIEAKVMNIDPNEIIAKYKVMNNKEKRLLKTELKLQMELFADQMYFEKAAILRDVLKEM